MIYLKEYIVTARNGEIQFKNKYHESLWHKFLRQFEGKIGWLTFNPKIPKRSDRQNRFYWLYIGMIAEDTGYTSEELHEYFKAKFLRHKARTVFGLTILIPVSTTTLTKLEFSEYIDKIILETGISAPDTELFQLAPLKK